MNKLNRLAYPLIAILSMAAAFSAHAESPTVDNSATQSWSQSKTRTQVQAELLQARADGSTKVYSISYNPLVVARGQVPQVSREEVRAEARVDRHVNAAAQMTGEDSGSFYLAQTQRASEASRTLAKR